MRRVAWFVAAVVLGGVTSALADDCCVPSSNASRRVEARKGELTITFLKPWRVDHLPWDTWKGKGSFEDGGRVTGTRPAMFDVAFGPHAARGSGVIDARLLAWDFGNDGSAFLRWDDLLAQAQGKLTAEAGRIRLSRDHVGLLDWTRRGRTGSLAFDEHLLTWQWKPAAGPTFLKWDNTLAQAEGRLTADAGRIRISGDHKGQLVWASRHRIGSLAFDEHRVNWRWDRAARYVYWVTPSSSARLIVGRVRPNQVDLTLANAYHGRFFLNLAGTNIRWQEAGAGSSAGLYERTEPIVEVRGGVDRAKLKALGRRVGDLVRHGSDHGWRDALGNLQDAVDPQLILINPRLVDRRLDIGNRALDRCLHQLARDFRVIRINLRELGHVIEVGGSAGPGLAAVQALTGQPASRWFETQERRFLANFSEALSGGRGSAAPGASFLPPLSENPGAVRLFNDTEVVSRQSLGAGWLDAGFRRGWVEAQLPLVTATGDTQLFTRTQANVAHVGRQHEVASVASAAVAVEGLAFMADLDKQVHLSWRST